MPAAIIEKYNIELFVVFGSYAENINKPGSDLDLAFKSSDNLEQQQEMKLLNELSKFYQRGDIDLVNLSKAEPVLKVEIAKKGRLLYGSQKKFEEFSIYAAAIYADTKFLRDDRRKTLKKKLEVRN
ncbi:putative nucleotidyltransferase [Halanaerobium saccharolyticum]|uniref:Putative nucleotidyltransferase n=1 Tax=Halanaerobium saccharolyticum TaxID=43595 RepID=A0A4R7YZF4_9FIRM|nr:putative nucleotidyltransferase [Halanaerobium saccharolyticum]TDW02913.1 putative nucleotidyltransferase [Halanaerobium saccharolyticum]TDX62903.1 putative nucleotidyltransferase [Halanaerobium saccharolyticum]